LQRKRRRSIVILPSTNRIQEIDRIEIVERITVIIHDWNQIKHCRISLDIEMAEIESVMVDESNICYEDSFGNGICVVCADWCCKYTPFIIYSGLIVEVFVDARYKPVDGVKFTTMLYGWHLSSSKTPRERLRGSKRHIIMRRLLESDG